MTSGPVPAEIPGVQRLTVDGRRPSVPAGVRIYAVGDIHGRLDLLNELLARIADDMSSRPAIRPVFIFLGDYIDRGPSSRETIDRLIEHAKVSESVFLKGNHEQIAMSCLRDRGLFERWMRLGGFETLMSYAVAPEGRADDKQIVRLQAAFHDALPQSHFRFFRDLQSSFALGDYFFAHAGVKPDIPLAHQKESDLLWIRQEFLESSTDFGKIVVHGHTPTREIEVATNRVNIDTGAYATGRLTCLVIDETSLSVIDTRGQAGKPAIPERP
jgi:serine/threonine protein phosphatase 1